MKRIRIEIPEKKYKVSDPWKRLTRYMQDTGVKIKRSDLIYGGCLYLNENEEPVYGYMCEVMD